MKEYRVFLGRSRFSKEGWLGYLVVVFFNRLLVFGKKNMVSMDNEDSRFRCI